MRNWILKCVFCILPILFLSPVVFAQVGKITIDLQKDKPKKFQTKTLKSEKTGQKKFTLPRRVIQNTVSHYNYYFNANNKINEVIERARLSSNDIYYKLLPFYSYSLNNTSSQANELDSVIYKATAGILLHDLRSEWVDNFYLLIGKAYLLKKAFDSASMSFQFINFNLYPKKKKDEDQVIVGSNVNGGNNISIANKETGNLLTKTFSKPPSRNDALVWQIRTLIEMEEFSDAAGLINTLRNDINFPERLVPYLEEINAYWFYKQSMYDSTATHLEKALSNTDNVQERARSEYLLAQLYELTKNRIKASEYYNKAIRHTTDPLLDIYAHLNDAKMYDSSGVNQIDKSIGILLRMARRDKFETYRDIIYYSAGELALEKPDTSAAEFFLRKSLTYSEANSTSKNRAFLKLADINFVQRDYKDAFIFYDSLQTADSLIAENPRITDRRNALLGIVEKINIIEREDSLQRLALMAPADRDMFIKALAKKLRKERGIKDDDISNTPSAVFDNKNVATDIFSSNNTKGDWYFYNASAKARGFSEFRSKWGKRQNVDNWRRLSTGGQGINRNAPDKNLKNKVSQDITKIPQGIDSSGDVDAVPPTGDTNTADTITTTDAITTADVTTDISYDGLLANVPTTDEKLKASHTLLSNSLFELGKLYQNRLEDYESAIETYERSLKLYPDSLYGGELYMNLFYCYQKLGNLAKANEYKTFLTSKFADSKFSNVIKNPKAAVETTKNTEATKSYEAVYNLFIEGQFDKALEEKKAADSLYGNNYWTPQLLYIESVYYVKQRQDSLAIDVLNNIITSYPNSALKDKAATMIDVLKRRSEIENYLSNLQIERAKENERVVIPETPVTRQTDTVNIDTNKQDSIVNDITKQDSIVVNTEKEIKPPAVLNASFNFEPNSPQFVAMLLNKVDPVYISEARNAFVRYNREKFSKEPIEIVKEVIDKDRSMLVFRQFTDAATASVYADKIKKDAAVEISWLPSNKYSFFIISDANLQLLKSNKDVENYLKILRNALPGKF